jgi:hypothetical protein
MALQGQSFFEATGDGDSWVNNVVGPNVWPQDDPYVTSVGGTSLAMNGAGSSYASETVWNNGFTPAGWYGSGYVGSGGGFSPFYPIPVGVSDASARHPQRTADSIHDQGFKIGPGPQRQHVTEQRHSDVRMALHNFLMKLYRKRDAILVTTTIMTDDCIKEDI